MRSPFALCLYWSCVLCLQGIDARSRTLPPQFGGEEYVDFQQWAETNHFQFAYSRKEKEEQIELTSRSAKVVCRPNSQRAEINGISLFLAFPVAYHQGTAYISQKDVDRSLRPILFPAKSKIRPAVRTIALSAGHGGKDSGYQIGSEQEKKYTLLLAKEVQRCAARAGLKTVLIRSSDKLVDREERSRLAVRAKADVFLELHYNSAGAVNNEFRGAEVYCLTPAGANSTNGGADQYGDDLPGNRHDERNILLAYQIHRSLVEGAGLGDRGIRRARFVVLRDAEMPAVLIETGFMSHPQEMRDIQDASRRRHIAQAILDGVLAYKRLIEH